MVKLVVEIEEKLLIDFRSFAVQNRGKIYGALKPEVELALHNHLIANGFLRENLEDGGGVDSL
jgi:hypothetical protein